ncbi:MAG: ThuA domain-containing protein [Bacteroidales bacterium]
MIKRYLFVTFFLLNCLVTLFSATENYKTTRVLVITGGHDYEIQQFREMFESLGNNFNFIYADFPEAFDYFLPKNRNKYDVIVFYHMWQEITEVQEKNLSECIKEGKPLVALHHSICAFDNWPEYINIIGGKYFHKPTVVNGTEYPACSYIHDLEFNVKILNSEHPVTKGITDFQIFDETYKGFYMNEKVIPLLGTDEPSSNKVIGWEWKYGKSKVVTLQSGHGVPTFKNPNYIKLLKQSIEWVLFH